MVSSALGLFCDLGFGGPGRLASLATGTQGCAGLAGLSWG